MDIIVGQIIVMFMFLLGALISTLTPVLISRRQKHSSLSHGRCQSIIRVCNSIGGGVLLATCFIALVPLVEHSYIRALSSVGTHKLDQPYAEVTVLCGFFFVIFIEQLVTLAQKKHNGNDGAPARSVPPEEESLFSETEDTSNHCDNTAGHSHSHIVNAKSLLRSIILVVTLGIHTLFEGMAIGLIRDLNMLMALTLSVMLHELCCAIALGVNLAQQQISKTVAVIVCIIFSVMMPSGIGLGLALGQINGFAGLLLTAILQGIATGTFIYVLFIEIVPSILSTANAIIQMVLMLVGCIFMTLLIIFTHDHSHNDIVANCTNASTGAQ